MRRTLAGLAAALCGVVANANVPWFDAHVADGGDWPADGAPLRVMGSGTWTGTSVAQPSGEAGERRLTMSGGTLEFELEQHRGGQPPISATSRLVFALCEDLPKVDQSLKGAIVAVQENGGATGAYYGLVMDAAGGTNRWARLAGALPDPTREVETSMTLRQSGALSEISYAVDGVRLTVGGAEWNALAVPEQETVAAVGYSGVVVVSRLKGEVETDLVPCTLTLPEVDGLVVTAVYAGGVPIAPDPATGAYPVWAGAQVRVVFAATDGYALDETERAFEMGSADRVVALEELPRLERRETVFVSELMASNEKSLTMSGGVTGLDWVEISNTGEQDVDLAAEGWFMTDDPTKKFSKWKPVEGAAVVPAGGRLIVWADNERTEWPDDVAHVALGLSGSGEAIALAKPSGYVTSQFEFGQQFKDVSYGLGRLHKTVLDATSDAQYRVGSGEWRNVKGPVGMSASSHGFQIVAYKFNTNQVDNVDTARRYIADPSHWALPPVTNMRETVNFNEGNTVQFPCSSFPGVNGDGFALVITGSIEIPHAGRWTFSVGSDDGFSATLSRGGRQFVWEYLGTRGHSQTYSTFSLEAGSYDLDMIYVESGGGNSVELSCCEGDVAFDATQFKLVGSEESGVLHAGAFSAKVAADVASEMIGRSASLEWKGNFALDADPVDGDEFRLRIRYADGFSARVNGHEFASAAAEGPRRPVNALEYAYWTIPSEYVHEGENLLEVTGVNDDVDDTEFFLSPEVVWHQAREELLYFPTPTPGAANDTAGRQAVTPKVKFSERHGWKSAPFDLELTCDDSDAVIYYTTDGTSPTVYSTPYTGPIHVDATTAIRAAVPNVDSILQQDTSATYLFVEDVVRQDERPPEGFPESLAVNNQKMRYGMARNVVDGADGARLRNGFTNSICTLSLVIDPKNLFDSAGGIYVNANGDGKAWERQTLVEQIDPVNGKSNEFSVPAGLRIRGAYSRGSDKAKHSFRLFFRSEYGMSKLEHPLFGNEGADSFQKVDLRTSQNYSWSNENSNDDTFIHECFSRDTQRDMGEPYNRSRYYNLFINGVYWGLYQTEERADCDYGETYFGGKAEDYDVIRTSMPGYVTGATDGNANAWNALWDIAVNEGFTGEHAGNLNRVRGLGPDGSRDPALPVYLDMRNLMAYMLVAHYTGDTDCPTTGSQPNNLNAMRHRYDGASRTGFLYMRHDAEHSMQGDGKNQDTTIYGTHGSNEEFLKQNKFSPAELQYQLVQNDEYRMALADFFYEQVLRPGGALTLENASRRFMSRMAELDDAIVCEAARWGHDDTQERAPGFSSSKSRSTWLNACRNRLNFVTNRVTYLKRQYQNRGWYPSVDVPTMRLTTGVVLTNGVSLAVGTPLRFKTSAGTVYYTTDGTDPRAVGGAVAEGAVQYKLATAPSMGEGSVTYTFRELKSGEWSALDVITLTGTTTVQTDLLANLRFSEFCGLPADSADGDSNEWIVLTNLSQTVALDAGGVRVVIGKSDDLASGKAAKCDFVLPEGASVPVGGVLRLDQANFGGDLGWEKITNNKVQMYLYNSDDVGTMIQSAYAEQKSFPTVYGAGGPGGGASLVATAFGETIGAGDWRPSWTLPSDAGAASVVKAVITADARVGAWLDGLVRANAARQDDITAFTGSSSALMAAWQVNLGELRDPEAELRIVDIAVDENGRVTLGGDLEVLGNPWRTPVNGTLKLYRYTELGGTPDIVPLDLENGAFPLVDALGDSTGIYRFFKLVLE